MKYRKISGTQLKVSEVGVDTSLFDPKSAGQSTQEMVHLLRCGVDRGINFFNASEKDEGFGEDLLGEAFEDERDRVILATQFGGEAGPDEAFSPKAVKKSCEESLKRLRTDHIELYSICQPRLSEIQREDIYETLEDLTKQGKILYWGAVLDTDPNNLETGELLLRFRKLSALQVTFHLLEQEPACELTAIARKIGISAIARVSENRPAEWKSDDEKKIKELQFLVRDKSMSLSQAALRFVLKDPGIVSALVACRTEPELNECAALSECPELSDEEVRMIRFLYKNNFYIPIPVSQENP